MRIFATSLLSFLLLACSYISPDSATKSPSLSDLKPIYIPDKSASVDPVGFDTLAALYQDALITTKNPTVRQNIKQRLASIQLKKSENKMLDGKQEPALFTSAAVAYKSLLDEFPANPQNDQILYQLGKTYEFNGEITKAVAVFTQLTAQFPLSKHYVEAQFRLAEYYFSNNQYSSSSVRYKKVIEAGEGSYYQKSLYMRAWSLFKLEQYEPAIDSFMLSIDLLAPNEDDLAQLQRGEQELLNDCFRVLSIIFATLDGPQSLISSNEKRGARHYDYLLYQHLAKHYLSQERFKDSADAYKGFIKQYPFSIYSHQFHSQVVSVYQQGGFVDEVLSEKEAFISTYYVNGPYWRASDLAIQLKVGEQLKIFLIDMSSYHHDLAQSFTKKIEQNDGVNTEANKKIKQRIAQHYSKAESYYQLFIKGFPGDKRIAEQVFLLAEVQYELANYSSAISNYEKVAYQFESLTTAQLKRAANAGYAAILTYDKLLEITPKPMNKTSQTSPQAHVAVDSTLIPKDLYSSITLNKIESELQFSTSFPDDIRASSVLADAANKLLAIGDYSRAITAAETLTEWQPVPKQALILSAWLIIAQASFETNDFLYAEAAYQQVLKRTPLEDKSRPSLLDRLAASIYKQGEQALAVDDKALAAEHYLRIIDVAPLSTIRVNAQYDAATLLLSLKELPKAVELLVDFKKRYPNNALTNNISAKLAVAYQALELWQPAAQEVYAEYSRESDEKKKASLLFLAASLYEKAGNNAKSIEHYRMYAHTYKAPFDLNIEAMFKLNELYVAERESAKQRFWLKRIIEVDKNAGALRTERSKYLAAWASSIFADDAFIAFKSITLDLPLKKSFKRKKKALKVVVSRYRATNSYGIIEFSTLSSYRLAEVYGQLSRDLIQSKRPSNLDELALEQYEILLEEQAYPFEEKAIEIHEKNTMRSWMGIYDQWVKKSFKALEALLPARYLKQESELGLSEGIY